MAHQDRIKSILLDESLDSDHSSTSRTEELESLIAAIGWDELQNHLLDVLRDDSRNPDQWEVAAQVFWGATLDGRAIAGDEVIALVYHRLPADIGTGESNLAWSIASKLKSVEYQSEYDPLQDPDVKRFLPLDEGE